MFGGGMLTGVPSLPYPRVSPCSVNDTMKRRAFQRRGQNDSVQRERCVSCCIGWIHFIINDRGFLRLARWLEPETLTHEGKYEIPFAFLFL